MAGERKGYEQSLIGLARHYGNYYEDSRTEFGAESWNHVIDMESHDMVYVQMKNGKEFPDGLGDWHGKKCYEYYYGLSEPCGDCYMKNVRRDNFYVCVRRSEKADREFFFEGLVIDHDNKPALFQKAIDITDDAYEKRVIDEYILTNNLSKAVLGTLMEESYITDNFNAVCREICDFFDADRALITEYCIGKLNVTYSKIPEPFTQVCTELSDEAIDNITNAIRSLNYIWVPDVPNAELLEPNLRNYWATHGIKSILLIPMTYNGKFIGTVSLHNIRAHFKVIDTLKLMGMAVAKCIHAYVMEAKAENQLYIDPLTGCLNLSGMKRKAYELLREHPENDYYFCSLDIRYFGGINRRYGFEFGDRILIKTAELLKLLLESDETFCRISADVFCFMAKYPGDDVIRRRFSAFIKRMQCFDELKAEDHSIEYQCGVYYIEPGVSIAQAIDNANLARLSLRDETGSSVAFYTEKLLEKSRHDTELLQDFRPALSHGEFSVYFQPQCSYSSKKVVGAEALVRWKNAKHGFISPADFIPLLERHGLIHELDRFVWEEVCRYQKKWIEMGYRCPVSVNLSRHDVLNNNISDELCALLDKYDIPKSLFPLEITETAYIKDSEEVINAVNKLKAAGFTVEMDDFGSGYSSLNALKDISVDLLKLDMKFLEMKEGNTGKGSSILSCIVRMTRWLNLSVLAEGVETKEQAEYLKNIGCDLMQGFYFAKPMPADDFEKILIEQESGGISEEKTEPDMHPDKFMESLMSNPLLFNNIGPAAVVESGADTQPEVLMFNDSLLDLLKMTREEYLPYMKNTDKLLSNILVDKNALNTYTVSERGMRIREVSITRVDGAVRLLKVYSRVMLEAEGRCIMLICLDDITELVRHG